MFAVGFVSILFTSSSCSLMSWQQTLQELSLKDLVPSSNLTEVLTLRDDCLGEVKFTVALKMLNTTTDQILIFLEYCP